MNDDDLARAQISLNEMRRRILENETVSPTDLRDAIARLRQGREAAYKASRKKIKVTTETEGNA